MGSFLQSIKEKSKRITVFGVSKALIIVTALAHLVLSKIQIEALMKLVSELCGLWMFFFVLLGLVCLFNAIRNKHGKVSITIFSVVMLLLTCVCGGILISYYLDAIKNQNKLETAPVYKAVALSIVVMVVYAFGIVGTVFGMIKNYKINKSMND